ncbi:hypothetical protein Tco_0903913 [Tanacetum coccineum]
MDGTFPKCQDKWLSGVKSFSFEKERKPFTSFNICFSQGLLPNDAYKNLNGVNGVKKYECCGRIKHPNSMAWERPLIVKFFSQSRNRADKSWQEAVTYAVFNARDFQNSRG